jgi:hypothetical protein
MDRTPGWSSRTAPPSTLLDHALAGRNGGTISWCDGEFQLTLYQGVTAILAIDGNRAGTVSGGYEGATVGDIGSRHKVTLECQNC